MRLLTLTNFYPPASWGGYEQWCQEVTDGLLRNGHTVLVLTSKHGDAGLRGSGPAWVHRELNLEMDLTPWRNGFQFFTHQKSREEENLRLIREIVRHFRPDAALMWGLWNLQRSIPALMEELMGERIAYYMGDYWPTLPNPFETYWQATARNVLTGFPKLLLRPIARSMLAREERPGLKFEHVLFPTEFMRGELRKKGIVPLHAQVVYGAIDTKPYLDESKRHDGLLSLLYVGRLSEEKGVHIAIEAVGCLVHEQGLRDLKLTIVGSGEPDYETHLHRLAEQKKLSSIVTFLPAQPKGDLPGLYQQADILLFPSIWPEPFGRVIVEAMASGVAVVAAPVGGAAEILVENENALTFAPNDPASLAGQLRRLIESRELRERLGKAGRETATRRFDVQRMTHEIEAYLGSLVQP